MKKFIILLGVLMVAAVIVWQIDNRKSSENNQESLSKEEQEFNDSGRAKAIEDEKDLWMIHEDPDAGFSLKYPGDVQVTREGLMPGLAIGVGSIQDPNGPSSDFPVIGSEEAIEIDGLQADIWMTFGRFEVCDVVFERNLRFVKNGQQIDVVLRGDKDVLRKENSDYFELNNENCGDELIWIFDKQEDIFAQLETGEGRAEAQKWFDNFDEIVSTIKLFDVKDYSALIQGTWVSVDDEKSVVEFKNDRKKDIYDGEELMENDYVIVDASTLMVGAGDDIMEYEIISISETELEITYLPRGNTLRYTRQ